MKFSTPSIENTLPRPLLPPKLSPDCGACATRKSEPSTMSLVSTTPGVSSAMSR